MPERLGFDRDLTGASFLAFHWRLSGGDTAADGSRGPRRPPSGSASSRRPCRAEAPYVLARHAAAHRRRPGHAREPGPPLSRRARLRHRSARRRRSVRDQILAAKARGATIVLNSHQLAEVERVCDRVVFIDHGRLTRSETLRGEAASRRRATIRVDAARTRPEARGSAGRAGIAAEAGPDGVLRLADAATGGASRGPSRPSRSPTSPSSRSAPPPSSRSSFDAGSGAVVNEMIAPLPAPEVSQRLDAGDPRALFAARLGVPDRRDRRRRAGGGTALIVLFVLAAASVSRDASSGALQMILARPIRRTRLPLRPLPRDPLRVRRLPGRLPRCSRWWSRPPPTFPGLRSTRPGWRPISATGPLLGGPDGGDAPVLLDVPAGLWRRARGRRPRRSLFSLQTNVAGFQEAVAAARRQILSPVQWERVFQGEPAALASAGRGVFAAVVFLAAAAVIFSRKEFAYGQD